MRIIRTGEVLNVISEDGTLKGFDDYTFEAGSVIHVEIVKAPNLADIWREELSCKVKNRQYDQDEYIIRFNIGDIVYPLRTKDNLWYQPEGTFKLAKITIEEGRILYWAQDVCQLPYKAADLFKRKEDAEKERRKRNHQENNMIEESK